MSVCNPIAASSDGRCCATSIPKSQSSPLSTDLPSREEWRLRKGRISAWLSSEATFGVQEVKWGPFPGGGSTVRLPAQMPFAKAMELLLTGDLIDAGEALACGFVNHVIEPDAVLAKATEIAEKISANGPVAVKAIRQSARAWLGLPEKEALALEGKYSAPVFQTEDAREGPRAFMEKRAPVYKGR